MNGIVGVVLAGGEAARLNELMKITNKHLCLLEDSHGVSSTKEA